MLTVAVLLSGPHRLAMLETALDSIPWESPAVSQVLIRHQGGPWNWASALRARMEAHPKVRILEFPDRVDYAPSYNRTFDAITTPWVMLLPDDDYLIRPAAKLGFEAAFAQPQVERYGLIAFGWYYLQGERLMPGHLKGNDLGALMRQTPKFSSTLFNMQHVRELGGFPGNVGGVIDTALLGSLAFRYDALISDTPVGAYRMHEGQDSAHALPAEHARALSALLAPYARDEQDRAAFEARLEGLVSPQPDKLRAKLQALSFRLRSRKTPHELIAPFEFRTWRNG